MTTDSRCVELPPQVLAEVETLYERCQMLQAYALVQPYLPLEAWTGVRNRIWAGRLAGNLGGMRQSHVLFWRAWRGSPSDYEAAAYYSGGIQDRRGPLAAWQFLRQRPDPPPETPPEASAYWHTRHAHIAATFRDFDTAEARMKQAHATGAAKPWLAVTQAHILETQDRHEESLAEARRSLEESPLYRPGIIATSRALQILHRQDEALAFLREADSRTECGAIAGALYCLLCDMEKWTEATPALDRFLRLSPLVGKDGKEWITAQRVILACATGDHEQARVLASTLDDKFHKAVAERIAKRGGKCRRVIVPIPFVRQLHMTCAPATLTMIASFWRKPVSQAELANAICYDGTPAHEQRRWALDGGWAVKEFTVTWESARDLLDRGLPFALATVDATSSHLQAVIGFDEARGTFLVRDPSSCGLKEIIVDALVESHRANGPRAMVLAPVDKSAAIESVALPDAELYDLAFAFDRALAQHDRDAAQEALLRMEREFPGHRIVLLARQRVAFYDSNPQAALSATEAILRLHPDDPCLLLTRLSVLRQLARRSERLALLEEICEKKRLDPVFWQMYADELGEDGRQRKRAIEAVRRAQKYRPMEPRVLFTTARLLWDDNRHEESLAYYRLAACMDYHNEAYARAYFFASRFLRQTETALAFIRRRASKLSDKNAQPAITLFDCLSALDRAPEAFAFLVDELRRRPNDGELLLFAADVAARFGKADDARAYLEQARGKTREADWLRQAAAMAAYRGDRPAALSHWRNLLQIEPFAQDATHAVATLLAETEGRDAARAFLDAACERFPFNCAFHSMRVQWLSDSPAEALEAVRRLLVVNPADAWARREKALLLARMGRLQEAHDAAEDAVHVEVENPASYTVRADILLKTNETSAAAADLRRAIELAVDNGWALSALVNAAGSLEEKRQALAFFEQELVRQVVFGEGLFAFRDIARGLFPPESVLSRLKEALHFRPDLWCAWSAVILQLTDMERYDEALAVATDATRRFPLLPRLWLDLARIRRGKMDLDGERRALEQALAINPDYDEALRALAAWHEQRNDLPAARRIYERLCAMGPLEAPNFGMLASALWRMQERDAAMRRLEHAITLDPGYEWAWPTLSAWAREQKIPDPAERLARELTQKRAGDARSWLILARILSDNGDHDGAVAAIDNAISRSPKSEKAYDLKAFALASKDRFDEALACCAPAAMSPAPPSLRVRGAWVESRRGNLSKARQILREVLREAPSEKWGWELMADWSESEGDLDEATRAADNLVQLSPLGAVPLGYRAHLKLRANDRAGAIADFRRALALDAEYGYAGMNLFDLLMEDGNTDEAEKVLSTMERNVGGVFVEARTGAMHVARRRYEEAVAVLRNLCRAPEMETPWPIESVAKALDSASRDASVDSVFDQAIASPDANRWTGWVWVKRTFARGRVPRLKRLKAVVKNDPVGRQILTAFFQELGARALNNGKDYLQLSADRAGLRKAVRAFPDVVKADVQVWGQVGYAFCNANQFKQAAAWLSDYASRPDLEPWMLDNYLLSLEQAGFRGDEYRKAAEHGTALSRIDPNGCRFHVVTAVESVLAGDTARAKALLAETTAARMDEHLKILHAVATRLLAFANREIPKMRRSDSEVFRPLLQRDTTNRYRSRLFLRCMRFIADATGSRWPVIWGYAFRYWPIVMFIPIFFLLFKIARS